MTEADVLRGLTAPVTVLALNAGANALDEKARLLATIAGLETTRDDLTAQLAATRARVAELEAAQQPTGTVFSFDVSSLGADATLSDAKKIGDHKALLGVDNVQNVRVFFGSRALNWNDARIAALTEKDSLLISFNAWNRAAFRAFLAATPERFRQRPGQVKFCFKHEFEAEWRDAADRNAWLASWLRVHVELAEELDASPVETQSREDIVKILLWYSQHIDAATKGTWRQFHGGQNFGLIGMDCYHYQVWLGRGRYATPEELFGLLVIIGKETGRPVCAPEWGGELAAGDLDGAGRAKAIREGGAYARANGLRFANWWCATGSLDKATGLPREHHVDRYPSNVAALCELVA